MQRYEYKVMPAPRRAEKVKGAKTTEERFSIALSAVMNALGAEGWDYVRADTLPCDERAGLTGGTKTSFQTVLIFRRALAQPVAEPLAIAAPVPVTSVAPVAPVPGPAPAPEPAAASPSLTLINPTQPAARGPRLGSAGAVPGPAPAIGPARTE